MPRMRHTMPGLVMIIAIVGAAALLGCSEEIQPATISDLVNRSFRFDDGVVLHPALANTPTTLAFTNNSTNFELASTGGKAVGICSLDPCTLEVTFSTYVPSTGPQANDLIRLVPCDFDRSNNTLIVGNGTITAISAPAVQLEN